MAFPFVGSALNSVSTHPELLAFARRVIGINRIMITHSVLVAKYAGARDYDQDLHVDYGNNKPGLPEAGHGYCRSPEYHSVTVM